MDEKALDELKRPLGLYRQGPENYKSVEERPQGIKALEELVPAGIVK